MFLNAKGLKKAAHVASRQLKKSAKYQQQGSIISSEPLCSFEKGLTFC